MSMIMKRLDQLNDEDIMLLIKDHNHDAFSVLVNRHSERFYALSYRTLFNQSDAEDIVQDSFLKIWRQPELWKPHKKARFTTWFYRIIVNACLDHNKKKSSQELSLELERSDIEDPNCEINQRSRLSEIEEGLLSLPERQRLALNLCFYEGLSNQQAADIMGIRIKALQSLIMRGKAALKSYFNLSEENQNEK